ncbi:protein FimG-like protein [Escherichia coli]|uniref:Protein FimG-like protein n=1 Tax=Escherichia coli TaxID=562 RepID=A0A376ZPN1_ECOLX|nr:protein FimG-like protein [Escherichia coli]STK72182.1 protein FimG-like protein [Escherichia coli]
MPLTSDIGSHSFNLGLEVFRARIAANGRGDITVGGETVSIVYDATDGSFSSSGGFAPIFPDICYHLTHYKPAAADIPVASDNPAHYADAIRYNARTPLQGSLLPLTRLVWA